MTNVRKFAASKDSCYRIGAQLSPARKHTHTYTNEKLQY